MPVLPSGGVGNHVLPSGDKCMSRVSGLQSP